MNKYDIHPDFRKYGHIKMPFNPILLRIINLYLTCVFYIARVPRNMTEKKVKIKGYKGDGITLDIMSPKTDRKLPALVYFHGGAFAMQATPYHKKLLCKCAEYTPCRVISVDYRLLPGAQFPVGVEDCYEAYKWVTENTESLNIDSEHIAVGGESAGGMLAIDVCLLANERKITMPCFQLLIYPEADAGMTTQSMKDFTDVPMWNTKRAVKQWKMYLANGTEGYSPDILAPSKAKSLGFMPSAYVEVADFDCLRDEGIEYAEALKRDGVRTELIITHGTVHGYDLASKSDIAKQALTYRIDALRSELQTKETDSI